MFQNKQKPLEKNLLGTYYHSIFQTIQCEGPYAGQPAVFIRMYGCNLQCPRCDTNYTSQKQKVTIRNIRQLVRNLETPNRLIVFTGGEPLRQNICPLIRQLPEYTVQIETNGCFDQLVEHAKVVISPKTPQICKKWDNQDYYFKYVIDSEYVDPDGLPSISLGNERPYRPQNVPTKNIYIQPEFSGDPDKMRANTEAAMTSCFEHGYTLSLQLHRFLRLP